ncbi:MAG: TetR/AcrR family transcriptional regulator [Gudongella sp.]|nr:TetR/AcrR family transcriptional regulator [Gudongella sp.]
MREVKEAEVRKAEIMDAAKILFHNKGYLSTTTQDIIDEVGISRGLLYYHFKSKEDILFAIVEKHIGPLIAVFKSIANDQTQSAKEKVKSFLNSTMIQESSAMEEDYSLHEAIQLPENTFMMDRINHKLSLAMTSCFSEIIQQGNEDGVFHVKYPKETAAYLMTGYLFVVNSRSFDRDIDKAMNYLEAFKILLSMALGVEDLFEE